MNAPNTVFCKRLKEELEALSEAPIKGPIGEIILRNVSREAWEEWLEIQMKIINEERLDLSEESAQKRLFDQMVSYLSIDDCLRSDA